MSRWFAARSKPGKERVAIDNLMRQNFETYFPQMHIERVHRGRIVNESVPLFPNYVLIRFALEVTAWRAINSTKGIIRLLSFAADGKPSPIKSGEIERLQQRENAGELCISEITRFKRGDTVRFKNGYLVDIIGTVVRTKSERVDLLINLLGSERHVTAPSHALEVVARVSP